jgi:hypothetical protein
MNRTVHAEGGIMTEPSKKIPDVKVTVTSVKG